MRIAATLLLIGLLTSGQVDAARCKVDGEWFDYDSPQCSQSRSDERVYDRPETSPTPDLPDTSISRSTPVSDAPPAHLQSWEAVAPAALERCARLDNPSMAGSCRVDEEMGFWAMHGTFDMPADEAVRAKAFCRSKTASYAGQAACMQTESSGYFVFHSDLGLPIAYGDKARADCMDRTTWSLRASCLRQAEDRYRKGPKSRSVRPPNAAIRPLAAAGVARPPEGYPSQTGPERFTVIPETDAPGSKMLAAPVPQPMQIGQRAFLMGIRSEDYASMEAFTDAVAERSSTATLSPSRTFIEDVGFLTFRSADSVHPGRNSAVLASEDNAKATLVLQVEEGRNYLIEFVIRSYQDGVYRLTAESDEREIEDPGGALSHVTAIVTAGGTGVTHVSLSKTVGHSFELFAVLVTSYLP